MTYDIITNAYLPTVQGFPGQYRDLGIYLLSICPEILVGANLLCFNFIILNSYF